ncbi:MAG: DUF4286 family protein [Sphingomonadales bacterium]
MYIYNVTIKVTHAIAADWLRWLRQEHIPEMIATGCFDKATLLQLVENTDEEGLTYAVQYRAVHRVDYDQYVAEFAPQMRQKGLDKWGDNFIAFRTLMEIVD